MKPFFQSRPSLVFQILKRNVVQVFFCGHKNTRHFISYGTHMRYHVHSIRTLNIYYVRIYIYIHTAVIVLQSLDPFEILFAGLFVPDRHFPKRLLSFIASERSQFPVQPCSISIDIYIYVYIFRPRGTRRLCSDNVFSVVLLLFPRSHVPIYNTNVRVRCGTWPQSRLPSLFRPVRLPTPPDRVVYTLIILSYAMMLFFFFAI